MHRFFDIVLSSVALVLLLPLFVPIMILLRCTGEGEVFYVQQRVGRYGQSFGLYKFATMLKNSPSLGTGTVTLKGDPRILPLGHFLRKTKINELPQLMNILRGDMSVVGPRPQDQRCFVVFTEQAQAAIKQVRPGLSGIGSIVFRDEEDLLASSANAEEFYDKIIAPYKGALEEWYVAHQGIRTYFLCIFLTVLVVALPGRNWVWRLLPGLPAPPMDLRAGLGYP